MVAICLTSFFDARPARERTAEERREKIVPAYEPKLGSAILILTANHLDRQTSAVDLTVTLSAPATIAPLLFDVERGRSVAPRISYHGVHFSRRYMAQKYDLHLRLFGVLPHATNATLIPFSLAQVFDRSGSTRRLPVQTLGQPQSFPGDWYVYRAQASVELPRTLSLRSPKYGSYDQLPLRVSFVGAPATRGSDVHQTEPWPGGDNVTLDLWLMTDASTRLFAYLTASVALVIAGIAFVGQIGRRGASSAEDTVWAIALGMLAVFPVREVVVPSDIPTLTRLDLLLGIALVLSASAFLLSVASRLAAAHHS